MKYYNDYFAVEDWKILDTITGHFFNEEATPFEAVCVEIGIMHTFKTAITGPHFEKQPIIRWISRGEYNRLIENSGVVIF